MTYRAELDGLRAIAVALVLIFHFNLLPPVSGGFVGVDVFFVLSGYLITGIVAKKITEGTFSLREFYVRRIRRLMPALYATCAATLAIGLFVLFPYQTVDLGKQTLAAAFQVSNVYYWRSLNYFGFGAGDTLLLHSWSLGVEAQFYLLYPVYLIVANTLLRGRLLLAVALLFALSLVLNLASISVKPEATFYLLPTRAWELAGGGLIALSPRVVTKPREWVAVAGVFLVAMASVVIDKSRLFPGLWALLPVSGTMLVLAGAGRGPLSSLLSTEPFRWVGQISYSLYLVHWPVAVFANLLIPEGPGLAARFGLTALSVGLAAAMYRLVENTFRKPRGIRVPVSTAQGYGLLTAGIAASAGLLVLTAGLPQRYSGEVLGYVAAKEDRYVAQRACSGVINPGPPCILGAENEPITTILLGDSHALASFGAVDLLLSAQGEKGVLAFHHGCAPVAGMTAKRGGGTCLQFLENTVSALSSAPHIDHVIVASIFRIFHGPAFGADGKPLPYAKRKEMLVETIERLKAPGRRVTIMLPVPVQEQDVPQALARGAGRPDPGGFAIDLEAYRQDNAELLNTVSGLEGVELIRPAPLLCTPRCEVIRDGIVLYADNNHLSTAGSRYLGSLLADPSRGTAGDTGSVQ